MGIAAQYTDCGQSSTGAYALLIWTHNFQKIEHHPRWALPGSDNSTTIDALVCGSGNNWGSVYTAAVQKFNRTVVGGEDATVGLGGLIQNGGHGLLSSHYGLASDQVFQVTVVTTEGHVLIANRAQNQDLFWAVRGGGGGQYGIVTEFVLKTHPVPENVVTGGLSFYPKQRSSAGENTSWQALAQTVALIPDIMDAGFTGTVTAVNKEMAKTYMGLNFTTSGVGVSVSLIGYNTTTDFMDTAISTLSARIRNSSHSYSSGLTISSQKSSSQSYWSYIEPDFLASSSGAVSLLTSRLLGRPELSDLPREDLVTYLQQIMVSQDPSSGSMLLFGLQAGHGPASVPEELRGSVLPAWRSTYAHVMTYGASINATGDPYESLKAGAAWYEAVKEPVWRKWAPDTGAYMNEGNAFSSTWKRDFYGENYDRLLEVKHKYDPTESLFVYAGVGNDHWDYNLHTGLLCQV
ncbi:Cannabidiolic acid synthase-like 2 [Talaromyces islandicus]|uniref:Cannabidiolic acid synthase-like 2 n=1 Tax=Talaromyces islandicus TaxID=28573 RepID=A0A0U1LNY1_TALIS|nr:Cannabidiolic acid synthase-like 2 [Talaromyces islandicus]